MHLYVIFTTMYKYSFTLTSRINLRGASILERIVLHPSHARAYLTRRASTLTDSHAQMALRTYPFEIVRDSLSSQITIAREWKPCVRPMVVASFAKSRESLCAA